MKVAVCGKFRVEVAAFGMCGYLRRVCLLVLRRLICSGYKGVKRHGSLQWVVVNALVFFLGGGNRLLEQIIG